MGKLGITRGWMTLEGSWSVILMRLQRLRYFRGSRSIYWGILPVRSLILALCPCFLSLGILLSGIGWSGGGRKKSWLCRYSLLVLVGIWLCSAMIIIRGRALSGGFGIIWSARNQIWSFFWSHRYFFSMAKINGGIGDFDRSQGIEWWVGPRGDDASEEIPVYNSQDCQVFREGH